MRYFPAMLDIKAKSCLVVGGGQVAQRKARSLLKAGAKVTVVAPSLTQGLQKLKTSATIRHLARPYQPRDLKGKQLVFAASSDQKINQRAAREAQKRGILVNVVDAPVHCTFIVPSVVHQGDLTIAISTGGRSPALAKKIRQELEPQFGREYAVFLDILGRIRSRLLTLGRSSAINKAVFTSLVEAPFRDLIKAGKGKEIDHLLARIVGKGFSLDSLGIRLSKGSR
ncbi:MAG: bifunctional precorrin-2 dehydrogenase/sirohydrochlorin ferrochelatase [Thermodesulfobacteriota bacterium]